MRLAKSMISKLFLQNLVKSKTANFLFLHFRRGKINFAAVPRNESSIINANYFLQLCRNGQQNELNKLFSDQKNIRKYLVAIDRYYKSISYAQRIFIAIATNIELIYKCEKKLIAKIAKNNLNYMLRYIYCVSIVEYLLMRAKGEEDYSFYAEMLLTDFSKNLCSEFGPNLTKLSKKFVYVVPNSYKYFKIDEKTFIELAGNNDTSIAIYSIFNHFLLEYGDKENAWFNEYIYKNAEKLVKLNLANLLVVKLMMKTKTKLGKLTMKKLYNEFESIVVRKPFNMFYMSLLPNPKAVPFVHKIVQSSGVFNKIDQNLSTLANAIVMFHYPQCDAIMSKMDTPMNFIKNLSNISFQKKFIDSLSEENRFKFYKMAVKLLEENSRVYQSDYKLIENAFDIDCNLFEKAVQHIIEKEETDPIKRKKILELLEMLKSNKEELEFIKQKL